MIFTSCLACGRPIARGQSYCRAHRPRRRSAKLRGGGATISRFRAECFRLAGGQCEAVVAGEPCGERDPRALEAHHVIAVTEGGLNDATLNGVLLCKLHHAEVESRKLAA